MSAALVHIRWHFLVLLNIMLNILANGQKKNLDTAAFHHWPIAEDGGLSPDGAYAYYYINIDPGYTPTERTLVIKDVHTDWSATVAKADVVGFTRSSLQIACLSLPHDSIALLHLGSNLCEYLPDIGEFHNLDNWIIYRTRTSDSLYIRNLATGEAVNLLAVKDIIINDKQPVLAVQQQIDSTTYELCWLDLSNYVNRPFYRGARTGQWTWDAEGRQLVFATGEPGNTVLYLSKQGSASSRFVLNDSTKTLGPGFQIAGIQKFSRNGKFLLFNVVGKTAPSDTLSPSIVYIYKSTDLKESFPISSSQDRNSSRLQCVDLETGKTHLLEEGDDQAGEDNGSLSSLRIKKRALNGKNTYRKILRII